MKEKICYKILTNFNDRLYSFSASANELREVENGKSSWVKKYEIGKKTTKWKDTVGIFVYKTLEDADTSLGALLKDPIYECKYFGELTPQLQCITERLKFRNGALLTSMRGAKLKKCFKEFYKSPKKLSDDCIYYSLEKSYTVDAVIPIRKIK